MNKYLRRWLNIILEIVAGIIFAATLFVVIYAALSPAPAGEANIGNLKTRDFNDGWTMSLDGEEQSIILPATIKDVKGKTLVIKNILPDDVSDGMTLCTRASLEDIYIYIGGELRECYTSESFPLRMYYNPSSYIFTDLSNEDAGKEIRIELFVKAAGDINPVNLGYGATAWIDIIKNSVLVAAMGFLLIIFGVIAVIMYIVFIRRFSKNTAVLYLSQMLVVVGVWLLSESHLRQLIFTAPSFSSIFSYTSIELIGFYVACYFDEVQSKKYHSVFTFLKTVMVIQIIVNAYLDFASIASFYDTLWFSHLWMVLGIFICFVTIGIDAYKKRVKNYSITCIGMISLVVSAFIEIICFYVLSFYSLGVVLSIGLIIMLICTMIQVIYDELKATKERALRQRKQTITTIETIANTIDAKDKYTGGHSERVGEYAGILAEAVSGEFGFTPDDVKRITYIGKMHDIGKIGIPDRILNKAGRLSDEEFDKMKEHVTIGRDLLSNLDDIEGLKEGVLYHHERFDGKGYPSGLEGENIPVIARILCIADSYDAMTSNRVYRGRLSDEEVLSELKVCSGTQFDPDLCSAFIDLINSKKIVPIV